MILIIFKGNTNMFYNIAKNSNFTTTNNNKETIYLHKTLSNYNEIYIH